MGALGDNAPPKLVPKTIESMREADETTVASGDAPEEQQDEEVNWYISNDEFKDYFSNVKITKDIRRDWREITDHRPEVILNNFTTRLGHSVARMLAVLFHYDPQFRGKRAVTFHNQRDYIFFRHHRYEFKNAEKIKLRELGPRFTLRLRSLQKGTFDSKTGEYEWIKAGRRH